MPSAKVTKPVVAPTGRNAKAPAVAVPAEAAVAPAPPVAVVDYEDEVTESSSSALLP